MYRKDEDKGERATASLVKCPFCGFFFVSNDDMYIHWKACTVKNGNWRKSAYDDSEYCPVNEQPKMALAISQHGGRLVLGGFIYSMSDRYIKKRREE